ncbi:MAG: stage III sporulation protein AE [Clostridia bacterium]|nr:stage III sporulation protein AE [Clostridia bacterium]
MKKIISAFFVLLFVLSMCTNVLAQDSAELQQEFLKSTAEQLNSVDLGDFDFLETAQKVSEGTWWLNPKEVLERLADLFFSEFKSNLSSVIKIVIVAVLTGVLCNLQGAFNKEGVKTISFLACFVVISNFAVNILAQIINIAIDTIDRLNLFMQGLIPVLSAVVAAGGTMMGQALSPSLFLCMQLITNLARGVFLPMILLITALSVVNNISGRFHITRLIDFARQLLKWSTGILLTVFIGLLGIQGFSFAFAGGVAGKTVKYAICNFIPIVGAVLSDSIEAVCASTLIVKNAVGITGALALVSICAMPLIKLLTLSLMYRLAAGISEPVTDKRIVNLLSDLAGNITQTFVILLMVCVMFIISVAMLCAVTNIPVMMK